jgi:hypothetical protein
MTDQDAIRNRLEVFLESFERHVPQPHAGDIIGAIQRGRRRRLLHGLGVALAAVVAVTGVLVPLGALLQLGDAPRTTTFSQPSVSQDPSGTPTAPLYGGSFQGPLSFQRTTGHADGWDRWADSVSGVSIEVPAEWTFVQDPKPEVSDPRMLFGAATTDVTDGSTPCQWLSRATTDGVVVWLVEWFDVAKLGGSPSDFPDQPSAFELSSSYLTGPHDCVETVPDEYTIPFQAEGRFFWFTVAVGPNTTTSDLSAVLQVLSSVKVQLGTGALASAT